MESKKVFFVAQVGGECRVPLEFSIAFGPSIVGPVVKGYLR